MLVVVLPLFVLAITFIVDELLRPKCNGMATTPPENNNLCLGVPDGRCKTVLDDVGSVRGHCEHERMVGEWFAMDPHPDDPHASPMPMWFGTYCDGKPCGEFRIYDHEKRSLLLYDPAGWPTGTWIRWDRRDGRWIQAQGQMSRAGKQGTWTYALESGEVVIRGHYLDDKIKRWEYACVNGNWKIVEDPEGPQTNIFIVGLDGTRQTDGDPDALCPRLK
jgi:hypothetical protein